MGSVTAAEVRGWINRLNFHCAAPSAPRMAQRLKNVVIDLETLAQMSQRRAAK